MTTHDISAFGRLCLFGEHSDWASDFRLTQGQAIVLPISSSFRAYANKSDCIIFKSSFGEYVATNMNELLSAVNDIENPFRYCCGTAYSILDSFTEIGGIRIETYEEDLPIQSGLSSSAAICSLVVSSFNAVYNLRLNRKQHMDLAYKGERLTGSECGRMDQIGMLPKGTYRMFFFDDKVQIKKINTTEAFYLFYVCFDSNKNTTKILHELKNAYLKSELLQEYLGDYNIKTVELAEHYLRLGEFELLGHLMNRVQLRFDDCVHRLGLDTLYAPKFHELINDSELQQFIIGGKEIGSHGDGSAIFLTKDQKSLNDAIEYIRSEYNYVCKEIQLC